MSSDEAFVIQVLTGLAAMPLEALVVGNVAAVLVAALADVIASKEAADRPKDRAQLRILRDTLKVKGALAAKKARRPKPKR